MGSEPGTERKGLLSPGCELRAMSSAQRDSKAFGYRSFSLSLSLSISLSLSLSLSILSLSVCPCMYTYNHNCQALGPWGPAHQWHNQAPKTTCGPTLSRSWWVQPLEQNPFPPNSWINFLANSGTRSRPTLLRCGLVWRTSH